MSLRHKFWLSLMIAAIPASSAAAPDRFFMYNLTALTTFTGVFLTPAGTGTWGANQALNDKDKAIDPSERLPIKDVHRGTFDVRLIDRKGRACIVHGVDLAKDSTFEIRDSDLTDCH